MSDEIRRRLKDSAKHAGIVFSIYVKWMLLAIIIGGLSGLLGTAFHVSIEFVTELRANNTWILYTLPILGALIVLIYHITKMDGVGTNNILRAVNDNEKLSPWLIVSIFAGAVLTHLGGGSAGREGAAIQMGGDIGYNVGKLLRLNDTDKKTAVISGMAAFFSALFGTPIGAALFAMVVASVGIIDYTTLIPTLLASIIAYAVSLAFGIEPTHFTVSDIPQLGLSMSLRTMFFGVLCAAVAVIFCYTIRRTHHFARKIIPNKWLRVLVGGYIVIALTIVFGTDYNGAGMDIIREAVENGNAVWYAWIVKIIFTAVTLGAGYKGGEVVPAFFVGAAFGCVVGPMLGIPAGFAAMLGMMAVFCTATNTYIASLILAVEMFGAEGLPYIAMVCAITYTLTDNVGLYSSQRFITEQVSRQYSYYMGDSERPE